MKFLVSILFLGTLLCGGCTLAKNPIEEGHLFETQSIMPPMPVVAKQSMVSAPNIVQPKPPIDNTRVLTYAADFGDNTNYVWEVQGSSDLVNWSKLTNFISAPGTNIYWTETNYPPEHFIRLVWDNSSNE